MNGPSRQETPTTVLWGASTTRTFRVIWAAEEVGIDYEVRKIGPRTGETQTDEYVNLNPKRKIPLLVEGDFKLSESVAICNYLVDRYGNRAELFYPKTLHERAKHNEWCSFILSELDETSLYIIRRHEALAHIYGAAPVAVDSAKRYFSSQLDAAGALFVGECVMGNQFGVPDILLISCLDWARMYGIPLPAVFEAYRQRVIERPAYQRAKRINQID